MRVFRWFEYRLTTEKSTCHNDSPASFLTRLLAGLTSLVGDFGSSVSHGPVGTRGAESSVSGPPRRRGSRRHGPDRSPPIFPLVSRPREVSTPKRSVPPVLTSSHVLRGWSTSFVSLGPRPSEPLRPLRVRPPTLPGPTCLRPGSDPDPLARSPRGVGHTRRPTSEE